MTTKKPKAILHIVNQSGGGTMRYIESLIHSDAMPYRQFVWYVGEHQHILFDVQTPYYYAFSATLSSQKQQQLILSVICHTGCNQLGLHLHSFFRQALDILESWSSFPMTATFHDHHFLSETPFINSELQISNVHITRIKQLLENAQIIVPSSYLLEQAKPFFTQAQLHLIPHGVEFPVEKLDTQTIDVIAKLKAKALWEDAQLTVATVGAIAEDKGLSPMKEWLAHDNVQFVCIGYTADKPANNNKIEASEKRITHAFFHHREVPELLSAYSVDVVIFFAGIAESFCYALSDIAGRVPVLAPNYGALGERVIAEQLGMTYEKSIPINDLAKKITETATLNISPLENNNTVETMAIKTAELYQQNEIADVLDNTLTANEISELLADNLHGDNLKWELASLVRQNYVLTDDIAHVKNDLVKRDNEFKQQDAHIKTQENYISELETSITGLKAHIENHENHNKQLENQLHTIQNSLSWRITKPIRAVRRLFNK